MTEKLALSPNSLNNYFPINYENIIGYPSLSFNYEFSSINYNNDFTQKLRKSNYPKKKVTTIDETFDLINKYRKEKNSEIINNYNNIIYSNDQRNNKKLEFSKSSDKILKSNKFQFNYEYNNKSIAKISKEIIKFKNKMNKDKEYLNNIQNKLLNQYNNSVEGQKIIFNGKINDGINKRRAYSLTNRGQGNN